MRRVNWIAIYDGWRRGGTAEALAREHGLKPATVDVRCSWIDQHFPPGAPARTLADLGRRLEQAQAALDAGELGEAERLAKTVTALVRAGRALEAWSRDMMKQDADPAGAPESEDAPREIKDYRAELERRLDRLAAHLKTQGAARSDDRDRAGPADPSLAGLGEAGTDRP